MTVLISVREHDIESPASLNRSHPNGSRSGMKRESSRVESGDDRASSSRPDISRRAMLERRHRPRRRRRHAGGRCVAGRHAGAVSRGSAGANAEPVRSGLPRLRAVRQRRVRAGAEAAADRTARGCRSNRGRAGVLHDDGLGLGSTPVTQATIPAHGGVGIVIEVGSTVNRVPVGDRVVVAGQAQCGACYNCLRGRADHCLMGGGGGGPNEPIAEMTDGTKVTGFRGGCAEIDGDATKTTACQWSRVCRRSSSRCCHDIGLVRSCGHHDEGSRSSPARMPSILGCGPLGLAAVQGARIQGAAQIIAVDPIRVPPGGGAAVGATVALDPNVEGNNLVPKIQALCKGKTDDAGGRRQHAAGLRRRGGGRRPVSAEGGGGTGSDGHPRRPTGVAALLASGQHRDDRRRSSARQRDHVSRRTSGPTARRPIIRATSPAPARCAISRGSCG